MLKNNAPLKEGELYKVFSVGGHTFEVRYGYYDESERGRVDPLPVFPDFVKNPTFSYDGRPVVAIVQSPCGYYVSRDEANKEEWCGDCRHYSDAGAEIALCSCELNRKV